MKMKSYILTCAGAAVICLLLISCGDNKNEHGEVVKPPLRYSVEEKARYDSTAEYVIDARYPVLKSGDEPIAEANKALETFIKSISTEFADEVIPDIREEVREMKRKGAEGYYTFTLRYYLFDNTEDMISILFRLDYYTMGAHGNTNFSSFNYDLKKGRMLKLGDVLALTNKANLNTTNYALLNNLKNEDSCFTDDPIIDAEFSAWASAGDKFIFYFDPYVLGPYACGPAIIEIPKKDLAGIVIR